MTKCYTRYVYICTNSIKGKLFMGIHAAPTELHTT